MKTIKEAAGITGITEQNIRYYERQKLLRPERNRENAYREYSEADIRRLKLISLFRRLDMPIAEIRKLFEGEISLEEAVDLQISRLESEKTGWTRRWSSAGRFTNLRWKKWMWMDICRKWKKKKKGAPCLPSLQKIIWHFRGLKEKESSLLCRTQDAVNRKNLQMNC